jgi:hypothetical protein
MAVAPITRRELNRATLSRQWLLKREAFPPPACLERVVGLQAQEARPPFVGLWSRLETFDRKDLVQLLHDRKAVRATAMRGTLHVMSENDYIAFRAALQPMLTAGMQSILRKRTDGLDIGGVVDIARDFFAHCDRTFDDFRKYLLANDPNCDERALAYAVRTHLALVQVPDESPWGYPSSAKFAPAEAWLGKTIDSEQNLDGLILRYLASFGPASATDAQTWLGAGGLAPVFNRLRERLIVYKDDRGRELFDLPDSPHPSADTPAPVRFLPDYDNLLLAHSDRSRVIADEYRGRVVTANLRVLATFLVDGFVAGTWKIESKKAKATLTIQPFEPLSKTVQEELAEEGERLLRFIEPEAVRVDFSFQELARVEPASGA